MKRLFAALVVAAMVVSSAPATAQTVPYEEQLLRLSEVLGALHYLRPLCGEEGAVWREQMQALLDAEKPSAQRRGHLVASFNRGYRTFAAIHKTCTEVSMEAIARYMSEAADLSREIVVRYGG